MLRNQMRNVGIVSYEHMKNNSQAGIEVIEIVNVAISEIRRRDAKLSEGKKNLKTATVLAHPYTHLRS